MDQSDGVRRQRGPLNQLGIQARAARLQDVMPATRQVKLEPQPSSLNVRLGCQNFPVLLMNLPLSLSAQIPNNAYMEDLSPNLREIHLDRAVAQFLSLYKYIAQYALVYLLPSTPGFQDQAYVSNLGVVLPHSEEDTVIISRFRSAPRIGEDRIGADFFKLMNFTVVQPPETFEAETVYFEGEADLKHIQDNLYIGAHGMRTSRNALRWASERFDMEIIPFLMNNPYLYHLDCCVFRISERAVMMCTSVAERICVEAVEQHCEIIDVSLQDARAGITNCFLLPGEVLCDSNIMELDKEHPKYLIEKSKIEHLETICSRFGRSMRVFCMSEFYKSGALLSCLIMHINHAASITRPMERD
jgi:N-dimethylarginine dimethylaminohydrolase